MFMYKCKVNYEWMHYCTHFKQLQSVKIDFSLMETHHKIFYLSPKCWKDSNYIWEERTLDFHQDNMMAKIGCTSHDMLFLWKRKFAMFLRFLSWMGLLSAKLHFWSVKKFVLYIPGNAAIRGKRICMRMATKVWLHSN